MTRETFALLEKYMLSCAGDAAHDSEHVRRVLYLALEIAETEEGVDRDLLIAACLLHDVGRPEQFADPAVCHARRGAERPAGSCLTTAFPRTSPPGWGTACAPTATAPMIRRRAWRQKSSLTRTSWT